MHKVILSPAADADIDELSLYISDDSLDFALRFQLQARSTCLELGEMPMKGLLVGEVPGSLRRWPVRDFENYLIFYRVLDTHVEIVRVLHGARDTDAIFEDE